MIYTKMIDGNFYREFKTLTRAMASSKELSLDYKTRINIYNDKGRFLGFSNNGNYYHEPEPIDLLTKKKI